MKPIVLEQCALKVLDNNVKMAYIEILIILKRLGSL